MLVTLYRYVLSLSNYDDDTKDHNLLLICRSCNKGKLFPISHSIEMCKNSRTCLKFVWIQVEYWLKIDLKRWIRSTILSLLHLFNKNKSWVKTAFILKQKIWNRQSGMGLKNDCHCVERCPGFLKCQAISSYSADYLSFLQNYFLPLMNFERFFSNHIASFKMAAAPFFTFSAFQVLIPETACDVLFYPLILPF